MFTIGLTGGIGSGKSTAANYFRDLGVTVVDSDQVAREVVAPGTQGLAAIAEHFGDAVILSNGSLNRPHLREIILKNDNERSWLERLLHPLIREATQAKLDKAKGPFAILESPLLLEKGLEDTVDRVLVIDTPTELQLARASQRDNTTPEQIQAIIDLQLDRQKRLSKADDVICNDSSPDKLEDAVLRLYKKYVALSSQSR